MLPKTTQKQNSCGHWMFNSHTKYTFLHFKHHMVTLIHTFGHFMLSCMWLNTPPKASFMWLNVTKATQKQNSCGHWMINSHTRYTFLHFKHHMVTHIHTFGHFMLSFMWLNTPPKTCFVWLNGYKGHKKRKFMWPLDDQ